MTAIVLAGGAGRRIGQPKALLRTAQGETFLHRLAALFTALCDPVIVVLGHQPDLVRRATTVPVIFALNPDPDRGQLSSLQAGLALADPSQPLLFHPVDTPLIASTTIQMIRDTPGDLVIPRYQGKRGHPVKIAPRLAQALRDLPADSQARTVLRAHYPEAVFVDAGDPAVTADIDTPEDLAQWIL